MHGNDPEAEHIQADKIICPKEVQDEIVRWFS
jgi:hypothetical protein